MIKQKEIKSPNNASALEAITASDLNIEGAAKKMYHQLQWRSIFVHCYKIGVKER